MISSTDTFAELTHPAASATTKHVRRILFLAAFFGWVKHAMARTVKTRLLGFSLGIPPTVFHPRFYLTSRFLGEYIGTLALNNKRVLDIGCGSGILSLASARSGGTVVALDVNPAAVQATIENALRNQLSSKICAIQSDLFAGLEHPAEAFDLLVCNPPFYEGEPHSIADSAFRGGSHHLFMTNFARSCARFLSPHGCILLVLSSDADVKACLLPFHKNGFKSRVVKVERHFFETLGLIELRGQ